MLKEEENKMKEKKHIEGKKGKNMKERNRNSEKETQGVRDFL